MLILKPHIFNHCKEIIFGFSPRFSDGHNNDLGFNLSYSAGDEKRTVDKNRDLFFDAIGIKTENVAYQHQVHENEVKTVSAGGFCGDSDALITTKKGLGLAVSVADCTPVFIFDPVNEVIAAVHSGWRGTEKRITEKAIKKLIDEYNSKPEELLAYIGPSISQVNYEVGREVAEKFDKRYSMRNVDKYLLDVSHINYDMLIDAGIKKNNIQQSGLCSFEMKELFHSYRRDGKLSGRSLGVIAMRDNVRI
ncbi:MAG: peptidoglycan editing factor PgeF [Ignavibacteriales bacterium]|nr:MAG: peptidoglycan editing factor PgeF [Ignavibacteriales bacterium]